MHPYVKNITLKIVYQICISLMMAFGEGEMKGADLILRVSE